MNRQTCHVFQVVREPALGTAAVELPTTAAGNASALTDGMDLTAPRSRNRSVMTLRTMIKVKLWVDYSSQRDQNNVICNRLKNHVDN